MDGEIVLDRGETTVMKLDDGEQQLMDEIQISVPQPRRVPRPKPTPYTRPRPSPAMEHQEEIDAFVNPNKQSAPPPVDGGGPMFDDDGDEEEDAYLDMDFDDEPSHHQQRETPSAGYASVDAEKMDILNKLARLERKGFGVNKRLNAYSSIEDLRNEYKRVTYTIDVDQSIKFSRKALMATVTGLEWANKKYNPFELSLDGWSESIMENLDDYDGVFEELHVKYGQKMQVAPELKLLMMVGGSAMMFHLTNSMFKAAIPNLQDVLKQNPGLQQSMVSAVQNAMPRGQSASPAPPPPGAGSSSYEMQGPGFDIGSLMGNVMMPPPPPMNTSVPVEAAPEVEAEDDDVSDIVAEDLEERDAIEDDVKEVDIQEKPAPKRRGRKKKTEINL
jgi:hypothetical protein